VKAKARLPDKPQSTDEWKSVNLSRGSEEASRCFHTAKTLVQFQTAPPNKIQFYPLV
jgi:hypothetical protein